ncbi:Oligosaccharide 4-alpha-D-glucosyltransferase [Paraburkholderia hiiakae]|uniref:Oligosaccharide 4-alpha-D-glucosyltransferase n=1 Tax=Paraburkholderia hiiakae TaxID=1081782 RepID=A0ABM8P802_9BURK|nr:glycoside hydrolase family 31 protein [Paraburkholderia hiiakae]CAD6558684.1 Oligosaccharide 4-alpha-D-glucosyltransferase [Paraburkholderia hiiakae]
MTTLLHPPRFALAKHDGHHLRLESAQGATIDVFVLEEDIVRVRVLPDGRAHGPRTWAIAPGLDDVPYEGRDRLDATGFTLPSFGILSNPDEIRVETSQIRLTIALAGGHCAWEMRRDGGWHCVLQDRATQAYNFGWWDERIYHYVRRQPGEMYLGLGERAGSLDRANQSYRMTNVDAMGYSAKTTDPLYKHIPFYLTWQRDTRLGFGLFYDTLADCTFDMGRELDNYHGPYRHFVADHGDLDYYFIASPQTPLAAVRRFTWLTGRPALMPKWGLGYSGSTMSYTDAPDAQRRMGEFLERCREHDMLCDSFHLSSGYTSIGAKRYVFNWNHEKFPDITRFVQDYLENGVKLCANIKPCLLRDHPEFEQTARDGLLIEDRNGEPAWVQFWDDVGAYIDFTNPAAALWWKEHVKDALLRYGIAATWNDNNEFEIWSPQAMAHGFGTPWPAREAKVLQTLLMMRASRDAQREHAPDKRPFLVSRSGGVGMHRYVQTWSGDNSTSWETLRYNLKMGLGLALSGVSNIGHDIGGFSGPAPEPELFIRWIQFGVWMPRFSIHSWNDDGTVNEPWMYPSLTPQVSALLKLRYRLLPYLYQLLWDSTMHYDPVLRPTFAEFPDDARCYAESDDMMVGASLLAAPVVEPGQTQREVWLPTGVRWTCYWSGEQFEGGQSVTLPAPWDRPVMLVREGSVIALNVAGQQFGHRGDQRAFIVVPFADGKRACRRYVEDDGESEAWRHGAFGEWSVCAQGDASTLTLAVEATGSMPRTPASVEIRLPASEARGVAMAAGRIVTDERVGGWRRIVIELC